MSVALPESGGTVCGLESIVTVWSCFTNSECVCIYIYIYTHLQCGMLSYLEEHVLKQLMYVDKMGSVRKDQVLIFPHFIVKCSVGSVSVDKGQH